MKDFLSTEKCALLKRVLDLNNGLSSAERDRLTDVVLNMRAPYAKDYVRLACHLASKIAA